VFEKQLLRGIYGAVQTEGGKGIRNDDELEKLMTGEGIVKYTRAQRIKWWKHPNRTGEEKQKQ
jgi:hypothetical protein